MNEWMSEWGVFRNDNGFFFSVANNGTYTTNSLGTYAYGA